MNENSALDFYRDLYPDVARAWGVFQDGRRFQWFATRSDAVRFVRQVLAGEHGVTIHYFPGM